MSHFTIVITPCETKITESSFIFFAGCIFLTNETDQKYGEPEGTRVEPTGEAKKRETPAHLATHENCRVGGETSHVE